MGYDIELAKFTMYEYQKVEIVCEVFNTFGVESKEANDILNRLSDRERNMIVDSLPANFFAVPKRNYDKAYDGVAVFLTEKERDAWLANHNFYQSATWNQVKEQFGMTEESPYFYEWDEMDDRVRWLRLIA